MSETETEKPDDRYVVVGIDRAYGEPVVLGRFEGPDAADQAYRVAAAHGDPNMVTTVVGLR